MPVPQDLIDVIYIRNAGDGCVFDEKLDQRTFYQRTGEKKSPAYWTRDGNLFKVSGRLAVGDVLELHYYRRLPAMNAQYLVTAANFNGQSEGGQLMTQQIPADVDHFLDQTGNGVLYFMEHEDVSVTNYLLGLNTAVEPGTFGIDGSLFFRPTDVNWAVTAQNWNDSGMIDIGGRLSPAGPGAPFDGTLWFDPQSIANALQVPVGNNQVFTDEIVAGGISGITSVVRTREGVQTVLTVTNGEPGPDQYLRQLRDDGRVNIIFNSPSSTDTYLVSYNSPPVNPENLMAFDADDGTRTPFNFTGELNLAEINGNPNGFTADDVSGSPEVAFTQQVFFLGTSDIPNQHPIPRIDTAYDVPTFIPATGDTMEIDANVPYYYTGNEVAHWLRDENERIVLFGALTEAFIYLEEDTMIEKYKTLFELEIEELNREEKMRQAVGGNISKNFNGRGLIQ